MPAVYTHYKFSEDVYSSLDEGIRNKIDVDVFNMFGKSFDILYFKDRALGKKGHNSKVNLYFRNIIEYIIDNNLNENKQILAYLYGSICHYVLDSVVHPFVFYKTGKYDVNDERTYKYRGGHDYMEYMIDAVYYKEETNKNIKGARLGSVCFPKVKISKELDMCINWVFKDTFGSENVSRLIQKGYKNFRFVFKHGMCSRFGVKYQIYRVVDKFNLVKGKRLVNNCYYIRKLDYSVLNRERKEWCYPVDKSLKYHYSIDDLYDIALVRAKDYIEKIESVFLDNSKLQDVLESIGDISYTSGVRIDKKLKMQYFED